MRSLRGRLLASLLAGLFVLLGAAAGVLFLLVRGSLTREFDAALQVRARGLVAQTTLQAEGLELDLGDVPAPEFDPGPDAEYFELRGARGEVVARSPSLGSVDLPLSCGASGDETVADVSLGDGRAGRALALRFVPPMDDDVAQAGSGGAARVPEPEAACIVVARSRRELDSALAALGSGLAITGLLLLAGPALLIAVAVRRGLSPVDRLAADMSGVGAESLGRRLRTDDLPHELAPIGERLNDLLERLDGAFARERRFTADVAHELRTPIAELRTLTEVALAGGISDAERASLLQQARGIALQMERLVATLLALVRAGSGSQPVGWQALPLAPLVEAAWRPLAGRALAEQLRPEFDVAADVRVAGDSVVLGSILSNVLSNAVQYSPPGRRLLVSARGVGAAGSSVGAPRVELAVENAAGDLGHDDLERMFEPFWRKDASRSDPDHSGLGLALVAALARVGGINVRAELVAPQVLRVVLGIPAA